MGSKNRKQAYEIPVGLMQAVGTLELFFVAAYLPCFWISRAGKSQLCARPLQLTSTPSDGSI